MVSLIEKISHTALVETEGWESALDQIIREDCSEEVTMDLTLE